MHLNSLRMKLKPKSLVGLYISLYPTESVCQEIFFHFKLLLETYSSDRRIGLVFPMTLHHISVRNIESSHYNYKKCIPYSYSNRPQKWCQCCVYGIYSRKIIITSLQNSVFTGSEIWNCIQKWRFRFCLLNFLQVKKNYINLVVTHVYTVLFTHVYTVLFTHVYIVLFMVCL